MEAKTIHNIETKIKIRNSDIHFSYGKVSVHFVSKEAFEQLKRIGIHQKREGTEWVIYGGISFFASDLKEAGE